MIDVLALPFDQYQRYRLVSDLLAEVRQPGETWSVLDVGGRTALLRSFLPRDRVTLVDLEESPERPLVLGDGSALPFADASFDVVAAFDTLEHVPVARRAAFVAECRRVARRYVILAGPYQSPEVEEAERILQQFLKDKLAVEHRYLEEHRHNGLPVRAAVEKQLRGLGAAVVGIGHGNLERWLALISLSMYMDYRPELRAIAARFQRFYNEKLYASDRAEPVYRHAIVAALQGARLPKHEKPSEPPTVPPGAVARITELAFELVAFERERQAFEAERERLRKVSRDLSTDLEGHRKSLSEARSIQSQQAGVIETLTTDLAGHRRSISDLEREIALLCESAEREIAGHQRIVAELTADVATRDRVQRETVDQFRREIAEHETVASALRTDLEAHRVQAATLFAEVAGLRQSLTDLGAELRAKEELIAVLRAELRHRWRSLKRALGPKRPTP